MTRFRPTSHSISCRKRNLSAILLAFLGVSALYFNFNPTPAGADPDELSGDVNLTALMNADSLLQSQSAKGDGGESADEGSQHLSGRRALTFSLLLLEKGYEFLKQKPDYTATVFLQERVGGALCDPQVVNLKMRHEPLSVYMKWLVGDKGRELLYVEGTNGGDMLVKVGGIKGKLLPPLKLNPVGDIAMREARHPATEIGMLELARQLIENRENDLRRESGVHCRMLDDQIFDERDCYCFLVWFDSRDLSPVYRKSLLLVDKEWCIPVVIQNYTWPVNEDIDPSELDNETLVEHYRYSSVNFNQQLADADFDRSNGKYHFKR